MTSPVRSLLHGLQGFVPASSGGLFILAYHLVEAGTSSPVDLSLASFERQMYELAEKSRVLSLDAAVGHLESGTLPAELCTVVTFDDAYRNFLDRAWPVLHQLAIPATLFVPVGFLDRWGPPPIRGTEGLPPLSWHELQELADQPLVTIGSHTRSHRDLRRLDQRSLEEEIRGSKEDLEERLAQPIEAFCYPRARWSRTVEALVGETYRCGLVAGGRKILPTDTQLWRLSRLPMRRDMPSSLEPVLSSIMWLEEGVADTLRRWMV